MKFNKLTSLFTLILAFGFFMSACDDTTDPTTEPVVNYPNAPTGIMATSIDQTTIALKWTKSTSDVATDTNFSKYVVFVNGTPFDTLDKGTITWSNNKFEKSTEYTFNVYGMNKDGRLSQSSASIKWAAAYRFEKNVNDAPIKLYVTASDLGSGLNIFDVEGEAPKGLKVASIEEWSLGLETKTEGVLKFGPASALDYNTAGKTLKTVTMVSTPVYANSLNEVYDSEVLSAKSFNANYIDLNTLTSNGSNAVFYVKEMRDGKAHYAKVLVKNNGGFLQGSDVNNKYIECIVSYQKGDDLPYAK